MIARSQSRRGNVVGKVVCACQGQWFAGRERAGDDTAVNLQRQLVQIGLDEQRDDVRQGAWVRNWSTGSARTQSHGLQSADISTGATAAGADGNRINDCPQSRERCHCVVEVCQGTPIAEPVGHEHDPLDGIGAGAQDNQRALQSQQQSS